MSPTQSDVGPKSKLDSKFIASIAVFEEKAQDIDRMSKTELLAFANEGVTLREQILASGQPYYEDPQLIKLYNLLNRIKLAIDSRP